MYVGFMYTSGSVHGLGTKSYILSNVLEPWYNNNLIAYEKYIDFNAGFCGDRQPSTSTSSLNGYGGTGTTYTYYGAYIRLLTNKTPSFKCEYKDSSGNRLDLYTVKSANKGNKALTVPIGLITADEVSYAGALYGLTTTNKLYYLYTGQDYWTITPFYMGGSTAAILTVRSSGCLDASDANYINTYGVRPVINLKADTVYRVLSDSNIGTSSNPYIVGN